MVKRGIGIITSSCHKKCLYHLCMCVCCHIYHVSERADIKFFILSSFNSLELMALIWTIISFSWVHCNGRPIMYTSVSGDCINIVLQSVLLTCSHSMVSVSSALEEYAVRYCPGNFLTDFSSTVSLHVDQCLSCCVQGTLSAGRYKTVTDNAAMQERKHLREVVNSQSLPNSKLGTLYCTGEECRLQNHQPTWKQASALN